MMKKDSSERPVPQLLDFDCQNGGWWVQDELQCTDTLTDYNRCVCISSKGILEKPGEC